MRNMSIHGIREDFVEVAKLAGLRITKEEMQVEESFPPHKNPPALPAGFMAVYVFKYGDHCLKVGKAGSKSVARYCNQHYGLNAPSTLARSLIKHQSRLSLPNLDESNIGNWIRENTTRINVLLPSTHGPAALALMESFIQCRLNPEFEGFDSQKIPVGIVHADEDKCGPVIGNLFDPEPDSWGLRGDPFLWRQMQSNLFTTPLPATEIEFTRLISDTFFVLSGNPITTKDDFYVEAFSRGGMSSGYICPVFWREQAITILKNRFVVAQSGGQLNTAR